MEHGAENLSTVQNEALAGLLQTSVRTRYYTAQSRFPSRCLRIESAVSNPILPVLPARKA